MSAPDSPSRIHDDLAKIVFGEKYELPPVWKTVAVSPKLYDSYVGRYQSIDDPKFVITITKENDQLWNRLGAALTFGDFLLH